MIPGHLRRLLVGKASPVDLLGPPSAPPKPALHGPARRRRLWEAPVARRPPGGRRAGREAGKRPVVQRWIPVRAGCCGRSSGGLRSKRRCGARSCGRGHGHRQMVASGASRSGVPSKRRGAWSSTRMVRRARAAGAGGGRRRQRGAAGRLNPQRVMRTPPLPAARSSAWVKRLVRSNTMLGLWPSAAYARTTRRRDAMPAAASTSWPITSPTRTPRAPPGNVDTSHQSPLACMCPLAR